MTKTGEIPLSEIASIQIYTGKERNNQTGLKRVLEQTKGAFVMNGPIFLKSLKPCCHLKANGNVLCKPKYTAWGISWNEPEDFCVERVENKKKNYAECGHLIIGGKKVEQINCGADMKYPCNRVAVGVKDGMFAYYATETNYTPEQLRYVLFQK